MNPTINVYYVYDDKEKNIGHIESIEFPDRDAVHFNPEAGVIDLTTLSEYEGFPLLYHCDGKVRKATIGKVKSTKAMQANGEVKEVMGVELTWENEDGQEE